MHSEWVNGTPSGGLVRQCAYNVIYNRATSGDIENKLTESQCARPPDRTGWSKLYNPASLNGKGHVSNLSLSRCSLIQGDSTFLTVTETLEQPRGLSQGHNWKMVISQIIIHNQ